jgi:hypothetical protein
VLISTAWKINKSCLEVYIEKIVSSKMNYSLQPVIFHELSVGPLPYLEGENRTDKKKGVYIIFYKVFFLDQRSCMFCKTHWKPYKCTMLLLPPFKIIRVTHNGRKKFKHKFGQHNINYMSRKLYHWKQLLDMNPMV